MEVRVVEVRATVRVVTVRVVTESRVSPAGMGLPCPGPCGRPLLPPRLPPRPPPPSLSSATFSSMPPHDASPDMLSGSNIATTSCEATLLYEG